ncbi:MAG TPA: hypothetical protein DCL00_03515 [Opitutae bacterium]|jgi:hypothetical protein|nr:hypothetical protein [Opitutae bacterium]|tara:strand:- start:450 stop:782 length:333 start_codon:yes stop_codon:yes gene_type:complete
MKLEEIPKSTEEVKKFSNGNMLLTLWFNGSHCKSMEVVFDMLSGTSILFCTNIKSHYYDAENEVRYGYELPNVASKCKRVPKNKIETLKVSISHLNKRIRGHVLQFLQTL